MYIIAEQIYINRQNQHFLNWYKHSQTQRVYQLRKHTPLVNLKYYNKKIIIISHDLHKLDNHFYFIFIASTNKCS